MKKLDTLYRLISEAGGLPDEAITDKWTEWLCCLDEDRMREQVKKRKAEYSAIPARESFSEHRKLVESEKYIIDSRNAPTPEDLKAFSEGAFETELMTYTESTERNERIDRQFDEAQEQHLRELNERAKAREVRRLRDLEGRRRGEGRPSPEDLATFADLCFDGLGISLDIL